MKKAYSFTILFFILASYGINAQTQTSSPPVTITDTLHYYFNKFYFKTGISNINTYPYFKGAEATSTAVTHLGSKFEVPAGETVTVTGIEAFMKKGQSGVESTSAKIIVQLSLCNLGTNGMPVLPPIDVVTLTTTTAHEAGMVLLGGDFSAPHAMNSDFALLFQNTSTTAGDTVRILKTAGRTPTSSVASGTNQCSDGGYGFLRYNSVFYSTRNFTMAPGFGIGTDYEFVIAPRVTYTVQSSQIMPEKVYLSTNTVTPADTMCTRTVLTFTNTSSKIFEHRMYNLNHFYLQWALTGTFLAQPLAGGFSPDSAITWRFEAYDLKGEKERVTLPYVNTGTVSFVTDRRSSLDPPTYCYMANQFRTRLRPMSIYGRMPVYSFDEDFKMCFKYCNDEDGINKVSGFEDLKVFPNPVVNGKSFIGGLSGSNTIYIYNLPGKVIGKQNVTTSSANIDIENQPEGIYFLKINNNDKNTSVTIKLVKD